MRDVPVTVQGQESREALDQWIRQSINQIRQVKGYLSVRNTSPTYTVQ